MIKPRLPRTSMRAGVIAVLAVAMALLSPLGGPFGTKGAHAASLQSVPAVSVNVPAGGSATLQVRAISLQPGSLLPQGALTLGQQTLATERVRTALYYGINWGYADTDPQQVALAIWFVQSGQWPESDHTVAQRIADAATASPGLPSWLVDGRSLVSLASQAQLSLTGLTLAASAGSSGTGTLTVRNTAGQDLLTYLPYGTIFSGATGSALVWAVSAGQPVPPAATATTAPAAPTDTPEPTATTPSGFKPGYVPPTDVPSDTPVVEPPTALPTDVPPTETAVPATDTPAPAPASDAPQPGSKDATTGAQSSPKPPAAGTSGQQSAAVPQITVPAKTSEGSSSAGSQQNQQPQKPVSAAPQSVLKQPGPVDTAVSPAAPGPPIVGSPEPTKTGGQTGGPGAVTGGPGAAPGPVETSQPAQVPNPQLTQIATIPVGKPTETPTIVTKTEPLPTEPPKVEPTQAAPEPTKAPVPEIVPGPIIDTTGGTAADGKGQAAPPAGTGAAPTNNPTTGGGSSSLPVWLSVFSALLVLGGWSLRRTANMAAAEVAVRDEAEQK